MAPESHSYGEALRKAVRWINDRRLEDPGAPIAQLVQEAAIRFSLSPLDEDFLWRELVARPPQPEAPK